MILKEKSLTKFQSEQDQLNEVKYLFFTKKIKQPEVKDRLLKMGYGEQGATIASRTMAERGKLFIKDFIEHLGSDFKDRTDKRFEKSLKGK